MGEITLDLRGQAPPAPVVRALRAAARAPAGSTVTVLTDSEICVKRIQEMAAEFGLGPVVVEDRGDHKAVKITHTTPSTELSAL